jgi:hypothetical protein
MQPIFTSCVKIVLSGLISAGLPCCRVDVEIRCRVTRQLVVMVLSAGNIGKPVVLLGTWNADGSITVHSFTNSEGAVNAALVAQFSLAKAIAEAQKVEVAAANDSHQGSYFLGQ